jgi:Lipopolysaccharide biosynthesis protein
MSERKTRIAVLLHLFDHTLTEEMVSYINQIPERYHVDVLVNMPLRDAEFHHYRWMDQQLQQLNPSYNRHFFVTENRGRDIGGFFYLIYEMMKWEQQPDFVVFMHTKRSTYMPDGDSWRGMLLNHLLYDNNFDKNLNRFVTDPLIGMKGSPDCLKACDVDQYLVFQAKKYGLTYSPDTPYISGTMFMARWWPFYATFQDKPNPRQRWKQGEYDHPSECHSWERLFAQLIIDKGYTVNGYRQLTQAVADDQ